MARISFEEFSAGLPVQRQGESGQATQSTEQVVTESQEAGESGQGFVSRNLNPFGQKNKDRLSDIPSDIGESFDGMVDSVSQGRKNAKEARQRNERGETGRLEAAGEIIGGGLRAGAGVVGQGLIGFGKLFTTPDEEAKVKELVTSATEAAAGTRPVQEIKEQYDALPPQTQRNIQSVIGTGEGVGTMFGLKPVFDVLRRTFAGAEDVANTARLSLTKTPLLEGDIPVQGLDDAAQTIAIRNGVDANESVLSEFGENPSAIQPDTPTPAAPQSTIGATVSGVGSQIKEFAGRTAREAQDAAARETRLKALPAPEASVRRAVSDERVIDLVNKLTPEELAVTRRLVEQAKLKEGDITTNTAHPKSLAGAELLKPVDYIIKTRKAVGAKLGNLRTQLSGKKDINTNSAFRSFHTYLKNDFQVQFDKQGQIIPGTGKLARGDVGEIQNLYDELRSKTFASQRDIDEFLQRSFKDYDLKQAREKTFSDDVSRIAGRARQDMRRLMPEQYNVLSTEYAKLSTPLTDIIKLLGYKGDLDALTAKDLKAGEVGLRVLGNASDRPQSIIDKIVRVASDNGYKSDVNLNNIIALTDQLEGLYDITMPRSFSGQVTSGMDNSNALGAMGDAATMNIGGLYNRAAQSRASQVEIQEAFDSFLQSKKNNSTGAVTKPGTVTDFFEPEVKASLGSRIKKTLTDQTGSVKNPLGGKETDLQRLGRLRESSANLNRMTPKALDRIEEYIDHVEGISVKTGDEAINLKADAQLIAETIGAKATGGDKSLANELRDVFDRKLADRKKAKSATTQTTLLETPKYKGKELNFVFNQTKADLPGDFAQDLEPAGRYMQVSKDTFPGGEGMTTGKVTFKNPLVVEFKSTGRDGWKSDLSKQYDGKTGRKLSQAIIKDGYDGIITLRDYGKGLEPVEAVNLQTFR